MNLGCVHLRSMIKNKVWTKKWQQDTRLCPSKIEFKNKVCAKIGRNKSRLCPSKIND